jgi:hypothetical protein
MVAIQIDARELQKLQKQIAHIKGAVPRATSIAVNRALNKGRTEVKREIRKIYEIKAKDIPVQVVGASVVRPYGYVTLKQGMLDLNKFKVQPKGVQHKTPRRPIKATVRRGRGGMIAHGFVAAMPSGYTGPFVRVGKSRHPIRKLLAISSAIMASQPSVAPAVEKAMTDTMALSMNQQIKRILKPKG